MDKEWKAEFYRRKADWFRRAGLPVRELRGMKFTLLWGRSIRNQDDSLEEISGEIVCTRFSSMKTPYADDKVSNNSLLRLTTNATAPDGALILMFSDWDGGWYVLIGEKKHSVELTLGEIHEQQGE